MVRGQIAATAAATDATAAADAATASFWRERQLPQPAHKALGAAVLQRRLLLAVANADRLRASRGHRLLMLRRALPGSSSSYASGASGHASNLVTAAAVAVASVQHGRRMPTEVHLSLEAAQVALGDRQQLVSDGVDALAAAVLAPLTRDPFSSPDVPRLAL